MIYHKNIINIKSLNYYFPIFYRKNQKEIKNHKNVKKN